MSSKTETELLLEYTNDEMSTLPARPMFMNNNAAGPVAEEYLSYGMITALSATRKMIWNRDFGMEPGMSAMHWLLPFQQPLLLPGWY